MKTSFKKFALSALVLSASALPFASSAQAADKAEIEAIVKEYILNNPEVIVQSLEKFQQQAKLRAEEEARASLDEHYETLTAADQPSIGPVDAKVTIVEFFDYNCGYCKKALPDVQKAAEKHGDDVRIVFQELPILGPTSLTAARWSLAAGKQDKYFEFHAALMEHRGAKNDAELEKIAKSLGLDVKKLKKDADSKDVSEMIARNRKITEDLGVRGTPAFIVNKKFYRGYLGENGLEKVIQEAKG